MAESVSLQTVFPPVLINKYILAQLQNFDLLTGIEGIDPIFPVQSSNIDDLYNEISIDGAPFMIFWDRLIRYGSGTDYWNKREQLVYTIHATSDIKGINISRVITEALDREDAAAQDVNTWLSQNNADMPPLNVFFHNFRVFQIDETRDILELASVKFNWKNKIIIEYDYHTNTSLYN
jgi:post-segregation antitoxin (ccd killing protein)